MQQKTFLDTTAKEAGITPETSKIFDRIYHSLVEAFLWHIRDEVSLKEIYCHIHSMLEAAKHDRELYDYKIEERPYGAKVSLWTSKFAEPDERVLEIGE